MKRRTALVLTLVGLALVVTVFAWWRGQATHGERGTRGAVPPEPATPVSAEASRPGKPGSDAAVIRGLVVDADGRPVAGARVGQPWGILDARTDADGRFLLPPTDAGTQEIEIEAPGFAKRELTVPVGAEPTRIVLQRGAVFAGTVLRADGSPAPDAIVEVADLETRSDAEGRFRIEDIPPGICRVRARTGDHLDAPDTEYDLEFRPDEHRLDYDITIDRAKTSFLDVRLVDHTGAPLSGCEIDDPWHEILAGGKGDGHGRFRLEFDGAPGEDVLLTASPPEGVEGRFLHFYQMYARTRARPDDDPLVMRVPRVVRVTFVGRGPDGAPLPRDAVLRVKCWNNPSRILERGPNEPLNRTTVLVHEGEEYTLHAGAAGGYVADETDWTPPPGGGTVEVVLQRSGRIKGRLLGADGTPLRRAWVWLRRGSPQSEDLAEDGAFELSPDRSGKVRFAAGADRDMPGVQREVVVGAGQTVDLGVVRLAPAAKLRGKVVDENGAPIRAAQVRFDADVPGYFPHDAATDAKGSFSLTAPSFASGVVIAWTEGRGTAYVEVGGVADPVTVTLHPAARAEVFVEIDPSIAPQTYDLHVGHRLESGTVLWSYVARPIWQAGTRRFVVADLAPGPILFRAKTPWDQVGLTEVDIKAGERRRVAVRVK